VFDTQSDVFAGEENVRAQVRQFVGMLRGLAIENDLTSMLLSHPSLTGMSSGSGRSGSTGWSNTVRSRFYLEPIMIEDGRIEADPDLRRLTNKKMNYGRSGYEITLRWTDGVFVPENGSQTGVGPLAALGVVMEAETTFLDLVGRYGAEGRAVNATPGSNYAPAVFARDQRGKGTTKRAFTTAMNRLFQAGKIEIEQYGPLSRRRSRLVLAGDQVK
jgi:RecA-family ATPase